MLYQKDMPHSHDGSEDIIDKKRLIRCPGQFLRNKLAYLLEVYCWNRSILTHRSFFVTPQYTIDSKWYSNLHILLLSFSNYKNYNYIQVTKTKKSLSKKKTRPKHQERQIIYARPNNSPVPKARAYCQERGTY